jgi:FMN-dependent NADH-azoreductase
MATPLAAKYAGLSGTALTPAHESAWRRIEELAAPFHAADKLLFGVPQWNFGIPYKLKHRIDVISQKDVLCTFDGTGLCRQARGSSKKGWSRRALPITPLLNLEVYL